MNRQQGFALALLAALGWLGCGSGEDQYQEIDKSKEVVKETHDHGHAHGPHDGHLIELGDEEFHAEVVFDATSRKTTVYILGKDGKTAHPISTEAAQIILHLHGEKEEDEVELALTPAPLEGEGEGMSSRFESAGDALPASFKSEEDFEGHLHVTIDGKEYSGDIEHDHDHDHDHAHEHGDDHDEKAEAGKKATETPPGDGA